MNVRSCVVWFTDRQGKRITAEVQATTVFEAACKAWTKFKLLGQDVLEESYKADYFLVEAAGKTYRVDLEKLLKYTERGRKGRDDTAHKKQLRWLLGAYVRIKHGED